MNPNFSEFKPLAEESSLGSKTLFWFRIYCAVLALLYVVTMAGGAFLLIYKPETTKREAEEMMITGIMCVVLGIVLFFVSAVGIFLPRRPWAWIYGMIMICLGLSSCCFLPFCVPLLINWIKPETKALFGRR